MSNVTMDTTIGKPAIGPAEEATAHRAVSLAVTDGPPGEDAAAPVVRALKAALGLQRACIHLLEEAPDQPPALRLAADAGTHAAFVLDSAPLPLDADAPAARAVATGASTWEGNAFDLEQGQRTEPEGVARWRAAISTHAAATLPLRMHGHIFGALTLQWSEVRGFGEAERRALEGIAASVAIALKAAGAGERARTAADVPALESVTSTYVIGAKGGLIPVEAGTFASGFGALSIGSFDPGEQGVAPFAEAFDCGGGRVGILLGTVQCAFGPAAPHVTTVGYTVRDLLSRGVAPAAVLQSLSGWAAGVTPALWLGISLALIDPSARFALLASAGPAVSLVFEGERRATVLRSETPLLGGDALREVAEEARLLLPGDRFALALSARGADTAAVEGALGPIAGAPGLKAADLLASWPDASQPRAAAVLNIGSPPA